MEAATLGKRSIALDLKNEEACDVLRRLIKGADVFIEGFKPGTIGRMGFDYDSVRAIEPSIIYFSLSGFGQSGPMTKRPAMDPVLQCFVGIANDLNVDKDNPPRHWPLSLIDMYTGLLGAQAIMAALYARRDTGKGRKIEVSLLQGGAMLAGIRLMGSYLERNNPPQPIGTMPSGVYYLRDGAINITMARHTDWPKFCDAIQHPELANDPRYAEPDIRRTNLDELTAKVAVLLKDQSYGPLAARLDERGIMNGRFNDYVSFLDEEQVSAINVVSWLDQPGMPEAVPMPNFPDIPPPENGTRRGRAPVPGEHSTEVLREVGYSESEIAHLLATKAAAQHDIGEHSNS